MWEYLLLMSKLHYNSKKYSQLVICQLGNPVAHKSKLFRLEMDDLLYELEFCQVSTSRQ